VQVIFSLKFAVVVKYVLKEDVPSKNGGIFDNFHKFCLFFLQKYLKQTFLMYVGLHLK